MTAHMDPEQTQISDPKEAHRWGRAIWIGGFVLTIIGAIRASNGERYRYPLAIRLIK